MKKRNEEKGTNQGKLLGLVSGQVVRGSAFYRGMDLGHRNREFYIQGFSALAEFEPDSSGLARGRGGVLSCALKDA